MRLSFEGLDSVGLALLAGLAARAEAQGAHTAAAALRGVELGDDYLSDAGAQIILAAWSCARDAHAVLGALPWGDVACSDEAQAARALASREQAVQLMVLAETFFEDEEGDEGGGEELPIAEEQPPGEPQPAAQLCGCARPEWYEAREVPRLCLACGGEDAPRARSGLRVEVGR